jgi:hypothetical protein
VHVRMPTSMEHSRALATSCPAAHGDDDGDRPPTFFSVAVCWCERPGSGKSGHELVRVLVVADAGQLQRAAAERAQPGAARERRDDARGHARHRHEREDLRSEAARPGRIIIIIINNIVLIINNIVLIIMSMGMGIEYGYGYGYGYGSARERSVGVCASGLGGDGRARAPTVRQTDAVTETTSITASPSSSASASGTASAKLPLSLDK